ncbi:MAG: hypothetical protein ACRD2K_06115 [Terriglobales bacterium]
MEIKTVNIRQQTVLGANNQAVVQYIVTFNVGTMGPFSITVPADEFTPELVKKMQEELAEKVHAIAGK